MLLKAPARSARTQQESSEDTLRFDRRRQRRANTCGRVVASFKDADGGARLTWMEVLDTSETGLGLRSPIVVPPGAVVTFHSSHRPSPHNRRIGMTFGTNAAWAITCEPETAKSAFRIGLRVSRSSAA
jgi:hypothetical protein